MGSFLFRLGSFGRLDLGRFDGLDLGCLDLGCLNRFDLGWLGRLGRLELRYGNRRGFDDRNWAGRRQETGHDVGDGAVRNTRDAVLTTGRGGMNLVFTKLLLMGLTAATVVGVGDALFDALFSARAVVVEASALVVSPDPLSLDTTFGVGALATKILVRVAKFSLPRPMALEMTNPRDGPLRGSVPPRFPPASRVTAAAT